MRIHNHLVLPMKGCVNKNSNFNVTVSQTSIYWEKALRLKKYWQRII